MLNVADGFVISGVRTLGVEAPAAALAALAAAKIAGRALGAVSGGDGGRL